MKAACEQQRKTHCHSQAKQGTEWLIKAYTVNPCISLMLENLHKSSSIDTDSMQW